MSWSKQYEIPKDHKPDDILAVISGEVATGEFHRVKAAEVAVELIFSGCVGEPKENGFRVTLSGHANPEHKPQAGWSPDSITITVSQTE